MRNATYVVQGLSALFMLVLAVLFALSVADGRYAIAAIQAVCFLVNVWAFDQQVQIRNRRDR